MDVQNVYLRRDELVSKHLGVEPPIARKRGNKTSKDRSGKSMRKADAEVQERPTETRAQEADTRVQEPETRPPVMKRPAASIVDEVDKEEPVQDGDAERGCFLRGPKLSRFAAFDI